MQPIKRRLALAAGLLLSACTLASEPVVVIGQDGQIMRGTATATSSGGSFSVSDGKVSCGGTYDPFSRSTVMSIGAVCTDGHKAIISVMRDLGGRSGSGTIRRDDGKEGTFLYGKAAAGF